MDLAIIALLECTTSMYIRPRRGISFGLVRIAWLRSIASWIVIVYINWTNLQVLLYLSRLVMSIISKCSIEACSVSSAQLRYLFQICPIFPEPEDM